MLVIEEKKTRGDVLDLHLFNKLDFGKQGTHYALFELSLSISGLWSSIVG